MVRKKYEFKVTYTTMKADDAEKFHREQPELKIFIVCLPKEKQHLLTDWVKELDDI